MRRNALFGLTALGLMPLCLAGCQFAGNPLDGFGGFIEDTHTFQPNPNAPAGADETMRRVEGADVVPPPLLPEPGDVWPGPMKPIPTMQDLQHMNNENLPPPNVPTAPPPALFPTTPPPPSNAPTSGTVQTPNGPVTTYQGGNGVTTTTGPGGQQGILVPNGNGTSTLIGPNGSVQTVPTPK